MIPMQIVSDLNFEPFFRSMLQQLTENNRLFYNFTEKNRGQEYLFTPPFTRELELQRLKLAFLFEKKISDHNYF